MRRRLHSLFSRRDFWKVTGVGSLLGSQILPGKPLQRRQAQIIVDYGGPTSQLDEVVLFPFDDFSIPLRYRLQVGLVSATNAYMLNTRKVLGRGKPGTPDSYHIDFYGTVKRVGDELRMWYPASPGKGVGHRVCYAVSKDGINWEKPSLGLVEYAGNTRNNLVDFERKDVASCWILYEPEDSDPNRRFKMVYEVNPFNIRAAFSPDGLQWKDSPNNPILKHNAIEPGGLTRFNGCYYLNGQGGNVGTKRALVTYLSYDFDHWTDAVVVGLRRDVPPHRQAPGPHAGEQVHVGASLWNRGNVLLGVYGQWHGESNDRSFVSMDLGLVVSNDAMHFREPIPDFQLVSAYESFVPDEAETMPPAPKLDQGQAFENVEDQTLFWYGPWAGGFIWVASWLRDRLGYFEMVKPRLSKPEQLALEDTHSSVWTEFLKMIPPLTDPHFISCPLQVDGPDVRIFINAAGLSEESHITVEILDQQFNSLPGYSGDNCIRVTKSGLRQPVTWHGKGSLEKLGRPFRIKVRWGGNRSEDAYVYALYVSGQAHA